MAWVSFLGSNVSSFVTSTWHPLYRAVVPGHVFQSLLGIMQIQLNWAVRSMWLPLCSVCVHETTPSELCHNHRKESIWWGRGAWVRQSALRSAFPMKILTSFKSLRTLLWTGLSAFELVLSHVSVRHMIPGRQILFEVPLGTPNFNLACIFMFFWFCSVISNASPGYCRRKWLLWPCQTPI